MDAKDGPSIQELVERAGSGERDAFNALVLRYRTRLEALIHLRLGAQLRSQFDPEDVFQETWLQSFRSIGSFEWRNDESFYRWLGAIAENVIRNFARRKHPGRLGGADGSSALGDGDIPVAAAISPIRRLQREERFARLEAALARLPEEYREVILLARVHLLPMKEIAERMGRTKEAASMLLYRALKRIKREFGSTGSFGLPPGALEWFSVDTSGERSPGKE